MRRSSILALLMLVPAGQATAEAETLKVDYGITLAGLPLGSADLASTFESGKYHLQVAAKLTGLAGMLTGGKGAATASGAVGSQTVQPASFALTSRSSRDRRTVRMSMAGGEVAALEVSPPLDEKPDLVLSGVNAGANMADDVTYSGTIAGAIEGTLQGIKSMALSQAYNHAGGRVVSSLEGGYNLDALRESVAAHVAALGG